jgi:hypothetical protein
MDATGAAEAGALGACTACAVSLGADPMLAPFVAAAVAVLARALLVAALDVAKSYRRKENADG